MRQIEVGGVGEGPMTLPVAVSGARTPSNPGPNTCMDADEYRLTHDFGTEHRKAKTYVFIDPQIPEGGSTTTIFRGRVRTMKRKLGFLWKDKLERSQVEIYGNKYLACSFEDDFTSGMQNTAQELRYKVDADYSAGAGRQTKSGEVTTKLILAEYTSTPFLTTYEH